MSEVKTAIIGLGRKGWRGAYIEGLYPRELTHVGAVLKTEGMADKLFNTAIPLSYLCPTRMLKEERKSRKNGLLDSINFVKAKVYARDVEYPLKDVLYAQNAEKKPLSVISNIASLTKRKYLKEWLTTIKRFVKVGGNRVFVSNAEGCVIEKADFPVQNALKKIASGSTKTPRSNTTSIIKDEHQCVSKPSLSCQVVLRNVFAVVVMSIMPLRSIIRMEVEQRNRSICLTINSILRLLRESEMTLKSLVGFVMLSTSLKGDTVNIG